MERVEELGRGLERWDELLLPVMYMYVSIYLYTVLNRFMMESAKEEIIAASVDAGWTLADMSGCDKQMQCGETEHIFVQICVNEMLLLFSKYWWGAAEIRVVSHIALPV